MIDRYVALHDLLDFARPIRELRGLLAFHEWDFDGPPLVVDRGHFRRVLERYLNGDLSIRDIEDWANLIEGREDIAFESGNEELLREIVYELANPELAEQLSNQRARKIVSLLTKD